MVRLDHDRQLKEKANCDRLPVNAGDAGTYPGPMVDKGLAGEERLMADAQVSHKHSCRCREQHSEEACGAACVTSFCVGVVATMWGSAIKGGNVETRRPR